MPDDLAPPDPGPDPSDEADPAGSVATLTSLDLSEIVRDSVARASQASPAVVVEVSTPPRLPAVGEADALAGVLRMLVDNACRQSDAGVTVKAKRGDEGISVHIIDRGPGMDRDHAPEGFEAAKTLISLHGGILWTEPLPAGGTKVGFTIPEEPPTVGEFDAEAAVEAIRLLERLAAPPAPLDVPDATDDAAPVLDEPIDLTALAEQAAAEASEHADHPPVQVVEPPDEGIEPPVEMAAVTDAPTVLEPAVEGTDAVEPVDDLETPVQLEELWLEPAPEAEDDPTEEVIPDPAALAATPVELEPERESAPASPPEEQPMLVGEGDLATLGDQPDVDEAPVAVEVEPQIETPVEVPA
ncbi:MAG TPA: ATP-binding protein, partial [Actinomycetota bacterium]|nr:ATP-binding protein [Actinomycetota bacterium]